MKTTLILIITLFSLTVFSQVDKILSIETGDTLTFVRYTDVDNSTRQCYINYDDISTERENMESALSNDENVTNDMSKVTRSLYQNLLVSLTGFDRITLNEPDNNKTYKLSVFNDNTKAQIYFFEQKIRLIINSQ